MTDLFKKQHETVLISWEEGITTITLNRPEFLNAMSPQLMQDLYEVLEKVSEDGETKVVVITGAGRAFCAGGDVAEDVAIVGEKTPFEYREYIANFANVSKRVYWMEKPVIAAINGDCLGAGFAIALSCDIRIASEKARFGSLFINVALVPDYGMTYFLPQVVGTSKALELMLTGEIIDATEAKRLGIVSSVVPHDELMKAALELAARIAQQPSIAIELTKKLVYQDMISNIAQHLDWETYAQELCFKSEDHRESVLAFLEKRPRPKFKGK